MITLCYIVNDNCTELYGIAISSIAENKHSVFFNANLTMGVTENKFCEFRFRNILALYM